MTARVSIGLPVHNGARYLANRLRTIKEQTFVDYELVVSDNASTDETLLIINEFLANDSRVLITRHERKMSAASNFRFVFDVARAPYFIWAADDDLWETTYLERLVGILDDHPEVVLAFSRFDCIDMAGRPFPAREMNWRRIWSLPKFQQLCSFLWADSGETQKASHIYGLIRRTSLLESDELFAYDATKGSDVMQLYSLLCRGEFALADEVLFHYRRKSPDPKPAAEADLSYIWRRATGAVPGRDGNLLGTLAKHHYFYKSLRQLALSKAPTPWPQRVALATLMSVREAERLATRYPVSIAREFGGWGKELVKRAIG